MPSPSDKDLAQPRSNWSRASAIEAFGVRYVQRRGWRDPVIESLGAHPGAEDLLDGCRSFPSQGAAIQRAQADAREEAARELERCDAFLQARSVRLRLALARTWRLARRRQVGILATATILEQRRREQNSILRNGVTVPVRRLPDPIRLPALLPLGRLVHVVDTRSFPRAPLRIVGRPILAHAFVDAPSHPDFDQLVRYRVRDLDGLSYDHAAAGPDRLAGSPAGVEVFLDPEEAERFVGEYASGVMSNLGKPEALPPPVERVVEDEPLAAPPRLPGEPADAGAPAAHSVAPPASGPDAAATARDPVPAIPPGMPSPAAATGPSATAPVAPSPAAEADPVPDPLGPDPFGPDAGKPVATDPSAAGDGAEGADAPAAGPDPEPRLDAADLRPARRPKGFLGRLFSRRPKAGATVVAAPSPEDAPREPAPPGAAPAQDPFPEASPQEDHLPVAMIIDEMEAAVIELAAGAAARIQRPDPPSAQPVPAAPDPRHPETASFLARGGLTLLTSAPAGADSPALRLIAAILPGSGFEEDPPPAGEAAAGGIPAEPEPAGLAA